MFNIDVHADVETIIRGLRDFDQRQLPYAMTLALNNTAKIVERALYAEMKRVFDRPTAYTMNSLWVKLATKQTLKSVIRFKDRAGKGTPAEKYLGPQVRGGPRHWKRHEKALQKVGLLPSGMFCVPGSAARIDRDGNMDKGQIVQILSYLRAFGEEGYKANMSDKGRARVAKDNKRTGARGFAYFVLKEKRNGLVPGVWQRFQFAHGSAVRPVLIFVKSPSYSRRFDFYDVAERVVKRHFRTELEKAIKEAMNTAFR